MAVDLLQLPGAAPAPFAHHQSHRINLCHRSASHANGPRDVAHEPLTLTMVFKLGIEAQKHWRRLNGSELIPKVVTGVHVAPVSWPTKEKFISLVVEPYYGDWKAATSSDKTGPVYRITIKPDRIEMGNEFGPGDNELEAFVPDARIPELYPLMNQTAHDSSLNRDNR
jgi:hypothetical protein